MEGGDRMMRRIQIRSSILILTLACISSCCFLTLCFADSVTKEEAKQLRNEVGEMFYHAFNGYMDNAFPLDELKPLSCKGEDTLGGYALTLVCIWCLIKFNYVIFSNYTEIEMKCRLIRWILWRYLVIVNDLQLLLNGLVKIFALI